MRPDGGAGVRWLYPFPFLDDVGVGMADELTEMSESLSAPVAKFFNLLVD
jgi:hypothetical protein